MEKDLNEDILSLKEKLERWKQPFINRWKSEK